MEAIVAVYSDWGIGAGGTQPIVVKADRKHFREVTGTDAVIVGRRTMEDFPGGKPLKNRRNIVITRSDLQIEGAEVVHSTEEALEAAKKSERCVIIGGAGVYRQLFPFTDRVYVTKIDLQPESDVFYPNLDADPAFRCTEQTEWMEEDGIKYCFALYEKEK